MAPADRQTTRDLADTLLADSRNYAFFRLLDLLHRLHGDNLEEPHAPAARRRVRLESHAGLGFPASDIAQAERLSDNDGAAYRVQVTFFGLHGPDSPLPGYYLDTLAHEAAHQSGIRPAFLDFFHHRLITLLHQAWRKYRYHVRFRPEASDGFSRYVFSLIGLNDEHLRGATPLPWGRLLTYAGLIASRSRSPALVAGIIAHCFDLEDVHIREFELRYTQVPADQCHHLGRQNGELGDTFVLGGRVRTLATKFTIVIRDLDQPRFRALLPTGDLYPRLCRLIDFLLRDPLACDLELRLRQEDVPPFSLQRERGTHLGWTSFVGDNALRRESTVRIQVRA